MASRTRTAPRKKPHQERAQATVDAILDATAHVLIKVGYEKASTNAIAEAAGVSIGSLYQYFPGKEALVGAIAERHMEAMTTLVRAKLISVSMEPVPIAVRAMIDAMFDAHGIEPKLHKVLIEQVPRVGRMERLLRMEREVESLLVLFLEARKRELRCKNLTTAAFLLVSVVEAVTHAAVLAELGAKERVPVADELSDMVLRYLTD